MSLKLLIVLLAVNLSLTSDCLKTSTAYECFLKALEILDQDRKNLEQMKKDMEARIDALETENAELRSEISQIKSSVNETTLALNTSISQVVSRTADTFNSFSSRIENDKAAVYNSINLLDSTLHSPHQCRETSTACAEDGLGNALYLDRHAPRCQDGNEFMLSWRLNRCNPVQINIVYVCCRIN